MACAFTAMRDLYCSVLNGSRYGSFSFRFPFMLVFILFGASLLAHCPALNGKPFFYPSIVESKAM